VSRKTWAASDGEQAKGKVSDVERSLSPQASAGHGTDADVDTGQLVLLHADDLISALRRDAHFVEATGVPRVRRR
jgi:hypothetical protein